MKRIFLVVAILAAAWAAYSYAVEANSGGRITGGLFVGSAGEVIEMVFPNPETSGLPKPSGFTMFSNDATEFWIQRRFAGGVRDTVPIHIPASRSILIPAPPPVLDSAGDNYRITIFVGGHTDSVYALPWYK
jgi:hypothetical protein